MEREETWLMQITLIINVVLLVIKVAAFFTSFSMSVLAS